MRPAWVSVAAVGLMLLATGCGAQPGNPISVTGTVSGGGLEMTLKSAAVHDNPLPYLEGPPGTHCAVYTLEVRSIDGQRHDLRPNDFQSDGATPVDAIARCGGPQLEPTWIDRQPRTIQVTILEGAGAPAALYWRP